MPLRFETGTPAAYKMPLTIRHLLNASRVSAVKQEIVYRDAVRLTYADLHHRIGRLASALTGLGASEGTTIAMLDWDSHRYLEAFFAVPMMGAVLQTVNIRLSEAQILYTLSHAKAGILLVHSDFLPMIEKLKHQLDGNPVIVPIMDGNGQPPEWAEDEYEVLLARADPEFEFIDFDENAIATTFYTSGTTGQPKAVCFTHRQLVLHALAFNAPFGVTKHRGFGVDDVYMPLTPMFHVHAWGLPYIATMLGVKQVYPGRFDADRVLGLREREKVTFSHCVPTVVQMLLDKAHQQGRDLSGWLIMTGGSAPTPALATQARTQGVQMLVGYGMSETGPVVTFSRPDRPWDGPADMNARIRSGVPIPLVDLRVVDLAQHDVPADDRAHGEVILRAPWLTPCYVGAPEPSEELWSGGWLHTGDVGTLAPSGSLQIRDRLKDLVKSGGEWICSLTLEELIAEHELVAEVAVIAIPEPKWQERPAAMIVPVAGRTPTLADINGVLGQHVEAGTLSRFALLDKILLSESLPKTSVGKIDKKAIRDQFNGV
jgi:fatty-acyl-CoA synthase